MTRISQTTPLVASLADAAGGIGNVNLSPLDVSAIARRVPLIWQGSNGPLPTLSIEALRLALGETTYVDRGIANVERAMESLQIGGYTLPTNSIGEFWLHFRHDDPRLYISAADVLEPGFDPELQMQLQGNLVLVGTSAAGLQDIRTTSLGERVPGVSIHAQILEQILTESYLTRSDATAALEILTYVCLSVLLLAVMSFFGPLISILTVGAGAGAVLAASHAFFTKQGMLLDASFPILAAFLTYGILTAHQFFVADQEKRNLRRSFPNIFRLRFWRRLNVRATKRGLVAKFAP
ncbi:CHASE2 domain-containing protein [Octadecabacter sp.]|nr:CHASE2 domain-containing protein [Octadecabacter sp.]